MSFLFRSKPRLTPDQPTPQQTHTTGAVSGVTSSPVSSSSVHPSAQGYIQTHPNSDPTLKSVEDPEVLALRKFFADQKSRLTKDLFALGETLGTGTFGRVRLVSVDLGRNRIQHFALKILKKSEILRLKQVEHLRSEKDILLKVAHPFIVSLYATFQDTANLYMVMEFVPGGELFTQLRKCGRFVNETARFYAAEIVLAFAYLHERNIIYRDLKPENLLIDRDGHIKVTDFGFAKIVLDRTWTLCGTPEYLAPEIIQSRGHGKAVDWWALGILIFEMLAGYPPFYDENPFAIYQKILGGEIEFPRHFDPYAKELVKRLLTHDRTKRYGCLKDGPEDIKNHKWFRGINWIECYKRRIRAPYLPTVLSADDTSNFEKYPEGDGPDVPITPEENDLFKGF